MRNIFKKFQDSGSLIPFSISLSFAFVALAVGVQAYAATDLGGLVCEAIELLVKVFALLFALSLVAFLWGMVKFIYHAGSDEKRKEGKKVMVWGIIALFVIVSLWGITGFIQQSVFGNDDPSGSYFPLDGDPC